LNKEPRNRTRQFKSCSSVCVCDRVSIYINVMNAVDYAGGVHTISMAELFIAI